MNFDFYPLIYFRSYAYIKFCPSLNGLILFDIIVVLISFRIDCAATRLTYSWIKQHFHSDNPNLMTDTVQYFTMDRCLYVVVGLVWEIRVPIKCKYCFHWWKKWFDSHHGAYEMAPYWIHVSGSEIWMRVPVPHTKIDFIVSKAQSQITF